MVSTGPSCEKLNLVLFLGFSATSAVARLSDRSLRSYYTPPERMHVESDFELRHG